MIDHTFIIIRYTLLYVLEADKGSVVPDNQVAYKGSTVTISCVGPSRITWYKNGVQLRNPHILSESLILSNANVSNTGVYTCNDTAGQSDLYVGGTFISDYKVKK